MLVSYHDFHMLYILFDLFIMHFVFCFFLILFLLLNLNLTSPKKTLFDIEFLATTIKFMLKFSSYYAIRANYKLKRKER